MKFRATCVFFLLVRLEYSEFVSGQTCTGTTYGTDPTGTTFTNLGTDTGFAYMATNPKYTFSCCGVISRWEVLIKAQGTIKLQIWRPDGTKYKLVGENSYKFDAADQLIAQTLNVAAGYQQTVHPNDHIGWSTAGTDMIPYETGAGTIDGNFRQKISPNVGTSYDWTAASSINARTYPVRATTVANSAPSFTDLDFTITYSDTDAQPASVYTIKVTDPNVNDINELKVTQLSLTSKFTYNTATKGVAPTMWDVGTYPIQFKVEDSCGNSETKTLTVVIENTVPDITNLPGSGKDILESTYPETNVFDLTVTDLNAFTCAVAGTTPPNGPFTVKIPTGATNYAVFLKAGDPVTKGLIYSRVNQWVVHVSCTDEHGGIGTGDLTVNLIKDKPPTFENLPATETISAKTTNLGTLVYTVKAKDDDSTQLFYNRTCAPPNCPFEIYENGAVKATENLDKHKTESYDLYINVWDGKNLVGPETLTVHINDINHLPDITNLPTAPVTVQENVGADFPVFKVEVSDLDTTDKHTFSATFTPGDGDAYFYIDPNTGVIMTKQDIDYEALYKNNPRLLTFGMTITANDGREDSKSEYIQINIADVNEKQTRFTKNVYDIQIGEGWHGRVLKNPFLDVIDPDLFDEQTYSMVCPNRNGMFVIDPKTGIVTQSIEHDLDADNVETIKASCTVTATDKGGHTVRTTLRMTINEENDNPPVLSKEDYDYRVRQDVVVGATIGTPRTTDEDVKKENKETLMKLSGPNADLFGVQDNGNVYVAKPLDGFPVGTRFDLTLTATNVKLSNRNTTLEDTAPLTIIIIEPPTTTTPSPTIPPTQKQPSGGGSGTVAGTDYNPWDDDEFLAWFIPAMILLTFMLGLLLYIIYRCCRNPGFCTKMCNHLTDTNCKNMECCKKTPKKIKVKDPPNRKQENLWNLWSHTDIKNEKIELK